MMKKIILILSLFSIYLQAQTDWERWEKKSANFQIQNEENNSSNISQNNSFLSLLKNSYQVLISDYDGDNCPFYPTCSQFYALAINETNILKGTLMFADRFTRDSNLFKSKNHYARHFSEKFFDPIENYLLSDSTIIFYSREKIVK